VVKFAGNRWTGAQRRLACPQSFDPGGRGPSDVSDRPLEELGEGGTQLCQAVEEWGHGTPLTSLPLRSPSPHARRHAPHLFENEGYQLNAQVASAPGCPAPPGLMSDPPPGPAAPPLPPLMTLFDPAWQYVGVPTPEV
jgi:hypothetical protein